MYTSPLKKTIPTASRAAKPGEKNGRTLPAVPVLQNKPVQKMAVEEEEPLQGKFVVQRQEEGDILVEGSNYSSWKTSISSLFMRKAGLH